MMPIFDNQGRWQNLPLTKPPRFSITWHRVDRERQNSVEDASSTPPGEVRKLLNNKENIKKYNCTKTKSLLNTRLYIKQIV